MYFYPARNYSDGGESLPRSGDVPGLVDSLKVSIVILLVMDFDIKGAPIILKIFFQKDGK